MLLAGEESGGNTTGFYFENINLVNIWDQLGGYYHDPGNRGYWMGG